MPEARTFDFSKEEGERIKRNIADNADPGSNAGLKHNKGRPQKAPYAPREATTARFLTNCSGEHGESLRCIERNYDNRSACQPFFDAYKKCRSDENEARKAANNRDGEESKGFFSWLL